MTRLPLQGHEVVRTPDVDDARERIGKLFAPYRLSPTGRDAEVNVRIHSRRLSGTSVNWVDYGGDVEITSDPVQTFYLVQIPVSGRDNMRVGRDDLYVTPGSASIISPTEPFSMRRSADCRKLVFRIDQTVLETRASEILGQSLHEPLRFDPLMDVSSGHGMSWYGLLQLMVAEIDRPGALIEHPAQAKQFEEALTDLLLAVQPHNYSDQIHWATELRERNQKRVPPRHVRDAQRLIDDHPDWEHTVATLAQHVGITTRALQKGFKAHLETSPSAYLRDVRLHRARDELAARSPEMTTVSQVARRWRLRHDGHFANLYNLKFGEYPSVTLRRSPARY